MASRTLQAAGAAHVFLALGHTLTAKDWQSNTAFTKLPLFPRMKARAGWYQGSVFFLIVGLLNLRWAQQYPAGSAALTNPLDQAMAGLAAALCGVSGVWYAINQDGATGAVLGAVAALQAYAGFMS